MAEMWLIAPSTSSFQFVQHWRMPWWHQLSLDYFGRQYLRPYVLDQTRMLPISFLNSLPDYPAWLSVPLCKRIRDIINIQNEVEQDYSYFNVTVGCNCTRASASPISSSKVRTSGCSIWKMRPLSSWPLGWSRQLINIENLYFIDYIDYIVTQK